MAVTTRVLVVDDEAAMCELIQEVLSEAGLEAHATTDSTQAAARLMTEKFDAVFLDVRMPSPDGIELARRMRASGFNQKTPIVMITGEDDPTLLKQAFKAGANFFLFKPVDRARLLRLIAITQEPIQREQRRYQRVTVRCKVALEFGQERLDGTTLDLSLNGLLVQADRVFPVNARPEVSLQLGAGMPAVKAVGRVVRVVGTDCMGIQLDSIGETESQQLQKFLLPLILAEMDKRPQNPPMA